MKRIQYVCTTCGRAFGRKFVAKRHLQNPKIHDGQGEITSVMDYMLGVFKGSYAWPVIPQIDNQPKKQKPMIDRFIEFQDKISKLAQLKRDLREIQSLNLATPNDKPQPLPAILLVGYLCDKCSNVGAFLLTDLTEYRPIVLRHTCKHNLVAPISEPVSEDRNQKIFAEFQKLLRTEIEKWVPGQKYLYAMQIHPEFVNQISPHIRKLDFKLSDLKKFAEKTEQRLHHIHRAIEESEKNSWTDISEPELLNLIDSVGATGAIYTITSDDGGSPTGSYLVSIVPPHLIAAKKFNEAMRQIGIELGLIRADPK